jgi:multidrug efflux pump subunit AcrA (membrane-fusion protein)
MIDRAKRVLSRRPARVAVVAVLCLLACGIAFAVMWPFAASSDPGDARWVPVQPQPLENSLRLVGRIEPAARILIAAPFEGTIKELAVAEGSRVESGQSLLTIDTTQLEIQMRQARAELLKAQSNVEKMKDWENSDEVTRARRAVTAAETTLGNTKSKLTETSHLYERGIVARQEVEDTQEHINSLEGELASARSELQAARNKGQGENRQIADMELANAVARDKAQQALYEQRELRAPFAGFVLRPKKANEDAENSVPLQVGLTVKQGMPLLELVNMERFQALARVEEADLHQLAEKMPVEITGEGFEGLVLTGHIANISSQGKRADENSGSTTYDVIVAIDPLPPEQPSRVRIGMSARLSIVTYHAENGFVLPAEAVRQGEDGQLFVIHRQSMNEQPKRVTVKTGRAVLQGVEVFGVEPGYVELPAAAAVEPKEDIKPQGAVG